jgi:hypothetical protein
MSEELTNIQNEAIPSLQDPSWTLTDRYPAITHLLAYDHPKLKDIYENAIVVIDANILISAWESENDTDAVVKLVRSLHEEQKLIIPAQIAREYFYKKTQKIVALKQGVSAATADTLPSFQLPRLKKILKGDGRFDALKTALDELEPVHKRLKQAVQAVQEALGESTVGIGPLSSKLENNLKESLYDPSWSDKERKNIHEQAVARKTLKIPPGFNDSKYGDYIIWRTILKYCANNKKNCIFVTRDVKSDWVVQGLNNLLIPQPELIQEFVSKTSGCHFSISSLADALLLVGENLDVVKKVKKDDELRQKREELLQIEQIKLEIANRLYAAAEAADSYASGLISFHPGRTPAYGESMEQFQARSEHFYQVEMPAMKARADAEAAAAWKASTAAINDYHAASRELMRFDGTLLDLYSKDD